jgi:hypothetical protein
MWCYARELEQLVGVFLIGYTAAAYARLVRVHC